MVNKSKILSDLSKMAVDAMGTFSGVKKEVETIVGLRVNKIINKMNSKINLNQQKFYNIQRKSNINKKAVLNQQEQNKRNE